MYTAYCRELDLASCGRTVEEAWQNLYEVFEIFLEETSKKGTLQELLEEAGLVTQGETIERPEHFIGRLELSLSAILTLTSTSARSGLVLGLMMLTVVGWLLG